MSFKRLCDLCNRELPMDSRVLQLRLWAGRNRIEYVEEDGNRGRLDMDLCQSCATALVLELPTVLQQKIPYMQGIYEVGERPEPEVDQAGVPALAERY